MFLLACLIAAKISFSPPPPLVFAGENYNIWAMKMKTYQQAHDLWNVVLNDIKPPPLRANQTIAQIKQHSEDTTKKYKAMSCLQSGVSDVIFTRIMACDTPKDFENLRMKDSETIKQYADRIMATVNNIKLLGDEFSDQRVVEKVITTLPEKYESKISSLKDSRDLSAILLTELINALYAQEQRRANRMEDHSEGAFQKEKGKKDTAKKKFSACAHCKKTTHLEKYCWYRPDIQCSSCKQLGHIEKVCKNKPKAQLQHQNQAQAAEDVEALEEHVFAASCFASSSKVSKNWLIDSGCTHHMASDKSMFRELDTSFVSKVRISNGELLEAKGNGKAVICTQSGNKTISEVLYVPDIDQNLLSVGQLLEKGYSIIFERKTYMINDSFGQELVTVAMYDRSFILNVNQLQAKAHTALADESCLWHKRMGHVNYKSLSLLHKMSLVEDMSRIELKNDVCEVCQLDKQTKLPFPVNKAWRAQQRLQLVYTDICGPMKTTSLNGSRYFALFIDDCTRFCWVSFLKQKSDVVGFFCKFKALAKNQASCKLKCIRSDNGTEYVSQRFQNICDEAGIQHQLTTIYTPQQNGVCERKNRAVLDMARLPTNTIRGKTPFEAWFGQKPIFLQLKVFGCLCYVLVPAEKRTKFEKRSMVFDPLTKKIVVSRDVKFNEVSYWKWDRTDASLLEENQNDLDLQYAEIEAKGDYDDVPVRGTRTLAGIYERCAVTMVEPFWSKNNADGSLNKYKARLVLNGYSQQQRVDFFETFATVARLDTIRLVFALATQKQWKVHQLDVKSAFLNGFLKEEIFIEQPDGFKVAGEEHKVYKLKKALYGLKQAPKAWHDRIDSYLSRLGFKKSISEPTLYVNKAEKETLLIVSLYVDDLLVTGCRSELIEDFKKQMQDVFEMTDLGLMIYFLSMEVNQNEHGIFISQQAFVLKVLSKFSMSKCKPASTLVALREKLSSTSEHDQVDEKAHFKAAKRVLRYVKRTLGYGVKFERAEELKLVGYSDSDWAGSVDDMKSTSGYFFTLGSGVFSWSSKKQQKVAQSTIEAEYITAATASSNLA
ncbi:hypothetical protein CXB51_017000 [Gossypium anomalum]|uniref:Integrase catalytic domain-containing protein n=1 Tax=Gossypium anomalum TaxID=47600 RepID=A0A8J6D0F7_9ROSI|nr:hypothetical protein CXB51_017000 [Gossypium anomalum]